MSDTDDVRECSNGPLPRSMESRAYFDETGREFALTRDDALEYLNWCEGRGLTVLGFDAWMPTRPGPTVINGGEFEGDASACRVAIDDFTGDSIFNIWVET
ncbi:MAG TPA: hypothetical protein VJ776_00410 [Thermoanaerobaculia bacterium]|nr:hypothetical protein [Thermoanaerobaculia bacterium]